MRATSSATASERPTSAGAERSRRRDREAVVARELGFALLVAATASAAAALVFRLWRADLEIPFAYYWDSNFYLMLVKGLLEHGGYHENPSLGAPFGQQLYDFAIATDRLNLWLIEGLGFFSADPAVVMNVFFLLTFPLTALSAYLCLRLLGVSRGVSTVCSVLFSLLPYHFWRGEDHLFLSAYYAVPLGAYLVVSVLANKPLFARRAPAAANPLLRYASRRSLLTLGFCVVVGSAGIYYAAFTLVLLFAATVLAFLARRSRQALATGGAIMALVAVTVALNLSPTIRYHLEHGRSPDSLIRTPQETERFSLVPVELILPRDDHRIGFLAERKRRYAGSTLLRSEGGQSLGLVATMGLLWLLAVALLSAVRSGWRFPDRLTRCSAVLVLVAVLVGTVGGASSLVAYLLAPQLRGWNRISVFIAFFCFVAVGLLLERARRALRSRARGGAAFAALLVATLAVGALDQTTDRSVPAYAVVHSAYREDAAFVRAIEERLPSGASVFQLPHLPFPEAGLLWRMADYDHLRGYLHSRDLRWSYAAMKGRPEDWATELGAKPLSLLVPAVTASGFDGIYVDRLGYADDGRATEGELERITGAEPLVSASGWQSFFDLRAFARRLRTTHTGAELEALRQATLHPILVEEVAGFSPLSSDGTRASRSAGPRAELHLVNPSQTAREVTVTGTLESPSEAVAGVTVSFADGASELTTATESGTPFSHTLELRPGPNMIQFEAHGHPTRAQMPPQARGFRLVNLSVTEPAHEPFLGARAASGGGVLNLG